MKLAISNIAWFEEMDDSVYELLKDEGILAIEAAPSRLIENPYHQPLNIIKDIHNKLEKNGLEICSLQSIFFKKIEPIFINDQNLLMYVTENQKIINFSEALQNQNIVFGSPKLRDVNNDEELTRAKLYFSSLEKLCEDNRINIAIEPNPKIYKTNFLNYTQDAIDFVKDLNLVQIGINLDLGTVIENNENLKDILNFETIHCVKHVHISEPYLLPISAKHKKIHVELIELLKLLNYNRYVSIEMKPGLSIEELHDVIKYVISIFKEVGVNYDR